jgi:hypothetical protein
MSIIRLDMVRQSKQRQYMSRCRSRLDNFIKSRVPLESLSDILRMAERSQMTAPLNPDMVWDYVEMRDVMLEFVSTHIASDIYNELKDQFWFDETFVSKDMVAERCLSCMILGSAAIAAE